MAAIFWIIVGVAILFGLVALLSSNKSDPKERAGDALAAAATGAFASLGCVVQLLWPVLTLVVGIWLFMKIFGH